MDGGFCHVKVGVKTDGVLQLLCYVRMRVTNVRYTCLMLKLVLRIIHVIAVMASAETPGTSSGSVSPVLSDVENKNLEAVLTKAGLLHLKQRFVKEKVRISDKLLVSLCVFKFFLG